MLAGTLCPGWSRTDRFNAMNFKTVSSVSGFSVEEQSVIRSEFGRLRFLGPLTHSVVNRIFESRNQKLLSIIILSSREKKMLPHHLPSTFLVKHHQAIQLI